MSAGPVLFQERQGQIGWVRALLLALPVTAIYAALQQLVFGVPFGSRPMSDGGLVILTSVLIVGFVFLWRIQLETQVVSGEVRVRLWPFTQRRIPLPSVARYQVRTYRAIAEFGGWGVRRALAGGGTAYTVRGNQGLELELEDGSSILIGSQRAEELAQAISAARTPHATV